MAPGADGRMKKIPEAVRVEEGRALARFGDGGWDPLVQAGRAPGPLRRRARRARRPSRADLGACRSAWVTAVPSLRSGALVPDFARAARGGARPARSPTSLARAEERPPQREMANAPSRSPTSAAPSRSADALDGGAVLLVDDVRFSGWTLAMVGGQLRRRARARSTRSRWPRRSRRGRRPRDGAAEGRAAATARQGGTGAVAAPRIVRDVRPSVTTTNVGTARSVSAGGRRAPRSGAPSRRSASWRPRSAPVTRTPSAGAQLGERQRPLSPQPAARAIEPAARDARQDAAVQRRRDEPVADPREHAGPRGLQHAAVEVDEQAASPDRRRPLERVDQPPVAPLAVAEAAGDGDRAQAHRRRPPAAARPAARPGRRRPAAPAPGTTPPCSSAVWRISASRRRRAARRRRPPAPPPPRRSRCSLERDRPESATRIVSKTPAGRVGARDGMRGEAAGGRGAAGRGARAGRRGDVRLLGADRGQQRAGLGEGLGGFGDGVGVGDDAAADVEPRDGRRRISKVRIATRQLEPGGGGGEADRAAEGLAGGGLQGADDVHRRELRRARHRAGRERRRQQRAVNLWLLARVSERFVRSRLDDACRSGWTSGAF